MTPTPEQVQSWAREAGANLSLPHDEATYLVWTFDQDDGALAKFAALACAWQRERDAQICEKAEPRDERLAGQHSLVPQSWELAYFQRGQPVTERMRAVRYCADAIRSDCAEPRKAG